MVLVPLVYLFTPWLAAADSMLPRWCLGVGVVAGSAIASCLLIYFVRIPAEEKALAEEFGERYHTCMRRTGGVLPRPDWFADST
jgi:protein-S-isoprenylcysteine O-methyltransferase Ste14